MGTRVKGVAPSTERDGAKRDRGRTGREEVGTDGNGQENERNRRERPETGRLASYESNASTPAWATATSSSMVPLLAPTAPTTSSPSMMGTPPP